MWRCRRALVSGAWQKRLTVLVRADDATGRLVCAGFPAFPPNGRDRPPGSAGPPHTTPPSHNYHIYKEQDLRKVWSIQMMLCKVRYTMRLGKIKAWNIKYGNRIGFSRGRYVRVGRWVTYVSHCWSLASSNVSTKRQHPFLKSIPQFWTTLARSNSDPASSTVYVNGASHPCSLHFWIDLESVSQELRCISRRNPLYIGPSLRANRSDNVGLATLVIRPNQTLFVRLF